MFIFSFWILTRPILFWNIFIVGICVRKHLQILRELFLALFSLRHWIVPRFLLLTEFKMSTIFYPDRNYYNFIKKRKIVEQFDWIILKREAPTFIIMFIKRLFEKRSSTFEPLTNKLIILLRYYMYILFKPPTSKLIISLPIVRLSVTKIFNYFECNG